MMPHTPTSAYNNKGGPQMITTPTLPPKKGYVEIEVDGRRTYRNVKTGVLIDDEVPEASLEDIVNALLGIEVE